MKAKKNFLLKTAISPSKMCTSAKIRQMAHLFSIAAAELPDANSYYASHASYCFAIIGEWGQAKEILLNILPRLEQQQDELVAQVKLAYCCNNLSWLYGSMGMYHKSLTYSKKCFNILEPIETAYGSFDPATLEELDLKDYTVQGINEQLAIAYDNTGYAYAMLQDAKQSLIYFIKALKLREKHLPPNHIGFSNSYNNLATSYISLKNPKEALAYSLLAMDTMEHVASPNDPAYAIVYRNLGSAYSLNGDVIKELHFCRKAVDICEKVLPKDHPDTAEAYYAVAHAYNANGDKRLSLRYKKRAVAILEEKFSPEHPTLLEYKLSLATAYGEIGNQKRQLDLLLELESVIRKHNLEQLSSICAIIGGVYASMGNTNQAKHYLMLHHIHKARNR